MRRILLRLWIFGLAFGLGISVSALWRLYKIHQLPEVSRVILLDPHVPFSAGLKIKAPPLEIVGGAHSCGPEVGFHLYELSDGSRITFRCEDFVSPEGAARALQKRLGKAEVAERSSNFDNKGRPIGENVLATTPTVLRLATYRKILCVTEAPSVRHLQFLEGLRSR